MGHIHKVYDNDIHFKIDAVTRAVKNASDTKAMIVQHDHNSERFTFEIPRMVDGHDMSTCNVVQVHYINTDSASKHAKSTGVYEVDDLDVSPEDDDVVICSWLISGNATKYVGKLSFIVRFVCSTDGNVDYAWNTAVHSNVFVSAGINNSDLVVQEYADVLEQWRNELIESGGVSDDRIESAVEAYLAENPVSGGNADFSSLDLAFVNGKLYITVNGSTVGTGVELGSAEVATYYNIALNLTNCVSSNGATTAKEHSEYTTVISPEDGFIMNQLSVTMGGEALTPENGTIHIEDVTGEIVITASAEPESSGVDLTGIVEWYHTEVQDALNYVSGLGTDEWVHHAIMTDTHYNANYRHSVAIVKALQGTGKFDKFMLLGDLTDTSDLSAFQNMLDDGLSELNGSTLFTIGNHDVMNSAELPNSVYYNSILANSTDLVEGSFDNLYYYYDNTDKKIRYICLNYGLRTDADQRAFLYSAVGELTAEWTVFILCHYSTLNGDGVFTAAGDMRNDLLPTIILADAQFGGFICGHHHIDYLSSWALINQATLDCDGSIEMNKTHADGSLVSLPRTEGTTSEQAITIMSINPTAKKVKFYRIGAYHTNKQFEYSMITNDEPMWVEDVYHNTSGNLSNGSLGESTFTKVYPLDNSTYTIAYYVWNPNAELINVWAGCYGGNKVSDFKARGVATFEPLFPGVSLLYPSSNAIKASTKAFFSVKHKDTTGYNLNDVQISTNPPILTNLTWENTTWVNNKMVNSGGGLQDVGEDVLCAATQIAVNVEPGASYTFSVDDETWTSPRIDVSFYRSPNKIKYVAATAPYGGFVKRITQNAEGASYTFTVPDGCHYLILSAYNLQGYTDKARLTKN